MAVAGLISKRQPELTPENRSNGGGGENCHESVAMEQRQTEQHNSAAGKVTPLEKG